MAKKNGGDATEPEVNPADMTGFALLQIIAWTNQEIIGCKTQLETEVKGNVIAHLQGKIPGCKFLLEVIKELFKLNEDFMNNSQVCDYANLSYEELLGAQIDIKNLEAKEPWIQFIARVEEKASSMKEFLLFRAKKSRSMFEIQGRYEGMTIYKEVFSHIDELINFRKTSEPLFHQSGDPDDPDGMEAASDPGTALVPTAGTGLAVRDEDLTDEDDFEDDDEEELDIDDFPTEGDPDQE
jgi:hypothetical protein